MRSWPCNRLDAVGARYYYRFSPGISAARHLLRYTRTVGIVAPEREGALPCYAPLLAEWLAFLKQHRGLTPGTLDLYGRYVGRFLKTLGPEATDSGLGRLDVARVRAYVSRAAHGRSRSVRKAVVSTLRSFLRFARDRGYLTDDLSATVERVPCFKHERLPRGPRWEDALRLLEVPGCTTTRGRRDYAILQLLLSYGVRARQVSGLCLDDIRWRQEQIRFAPLKGGRQVVVPLLPTVGDALLHYLQAGRPSTAIRHLFLSSHPPFPPLRSAAISSLVARTMEHAQIETPHRGSHALRHAWATRLLAEGQSLKTIADLLGHRSLETTRIYAKVDFTRLRTVGLPWPEGDAP